MGLYQSPSHRQKTSDFLSKYFVGNEDLRSFLNCHTPIGCVPQKRVPPNGYKWIFMTKYENKKAMEEEAPL